MSLSYKQFDETDLAELRKICAPERVIPGAGISEDYCHDELSGTFSRPDVLVKAMSAEEVSAIMKASSPEFVGEIRFREFAKLVI